jgi:restriction system protein
MAIPDYQTLMLPVLKLAGDGREHRIGDVIGQLAREFELTEEEKKQVLPSGSQFTFANRVGWAKTYLVQAGLLEATRRAHFKITSRGKKVLAEGPSRIDNDYLSQFAEFVQFRERGRANDGVESSVTTDSLALPLPAETPDEILRSTTRQMETALGKELLDRILNSPLHFLRPSSSNYFSQWVTAARGRMQVGRSVALVTGGSTG